MLINTCSLTELCRRTLLFIVIVAVIVSLDETERGREREKERGGEEKGEIVGTLFLQFYRITIEANFRNRSKIDWTTD